MKIKFPRRWDTPTKMSYLERRIIIASIMYYDYDENIISDADYNDISHQLAEMMTPENLDRSTYGYAFHEFNGSTGFDLVYKLKEEDRKYLEAITQTLLGRISISECAKCIPTQKKKKGKLF